LIGAAGFDGFTPGKSHKAAIGYWLAKPFRGQGVMTAVVKRVCQHAFSKSALEKIISFTFSHNTRSQAVLEKSGFVFEGCFRKHIKKDDQYIDCKFYGLFS